MEVSTSQLSGAALNWAVAEAEGLNIRIALPNPEPHVIRIIVGDEPNRSFSPSTDWNVAGPLLHDEKFTVKPCLAGEVSGKWMASRQLSVTEPSGGQHTYYGDTPLVAILRCYVSKKLGDTVELPDQLVYALESPIRKYMY